jgi:uncharacterized protein
MKHLHRITLVSIGWLFLLLGVAGLFLPFLQGILFIFVGLLLLSAQSSYIHTHVGRARSRFPKLHRQLERLEAKYPRLFKRHDHH